MDRTASIFQAETRDPGVRFNLVAHHMQAQTVLRRTSESSKLWIELDEIRTERKLPERVTIALYSAATGYRVRRSTYERDAEIEPGTAARDLRMLASANLLRPVGETRARVYIGTEELRHVRNRIVGDRKPLADPYARLIAS